MPGAVSEAERLRQCRLLFERALRDGVTVSAARDSAARERWEKGTGRSMVACGTLDFDPAGADDRIAEPWMMRE